MSIDTYAKIEIMIREGHWDVFTRNYELTNNSHKLMAKYLFGNSKKSEKQLSFRHLMKARQIAKSALKDWDNVHLLLPQHDYAKYLKELYKEPLYDWGDESDLKFFVRQIDNMFEDIRKIKKKYRNKCSIRLQNVYQI